MAHLTHDSPNAVQELFLDNQKIPSIRHLLSPDAATSLAEYVNLTHLSLNNCGLGSLEGFPDLPHLQKLDLGDNKISGELEALSKLPSLEFLDLSNNRLASVASLQPLLHLPSLRHLNLLECDVTKSNGYPQSVFTLIPNLVSLDDKDRNGNEVDTYSEEDDEEEEEEPELEDEEDNFEEFDDGAGPEDEYEEHEGQVQEPTHADYDEDEDDDNDDEGEAEADDDAEGDEEEDNDEEEEEVDDDDDDDDGEQGEEEGDDEAGYPDRGGKGLPSSTIHALDTDDDDGIGNGQTTEGVFGDEFSGIGLEADLSYLTNHDTTGTGEEGLNLNVTFGETSRDEKGESDEDDRIAQTTPGYVPQGHKRKRNIGEEFGLGLDNFMDNNGDQLGDFVNDWEEGEESAFKKIK
ncbi:hypothetical protein SpCBS45565_g04933 [Spizellomyces sp. 'palustris']|nr:hypothetical protein SpCBS45565_g04933 [Spizellomyces sp. 'palustris']